MKIKSSLATAVAMAAVSCVSLSAFAESADPASSAAESTASETSNVSETSTAVSDTSTAVSQTSSETSVTSAVEAADPMEGNNPGTGVTGAAVVFGMVAVAGAALVISHKHE